jgi:hypothetical protein
MGILRVKYIHLMNIQSFGLMLENGKLKIKFDVQWNYELTTANGVWLLPGLRLRESFRFGPVDYM